ncbi:unnamed protein product [Effrenium voratum]|nr:unnamed protein product [Effrenium voratum]
MKSLALSDHFDSFGKVRFQRLGLTFAAKQMMPQMAAYGSVSEVPPAEKKKEKSAKAFILSQEALAQDLRRWTQHSRTLAESVQEEDRHKDAEVKQRQVAILFAELPRFLEYLPSSVPLASMEPELGRQEDPQARAAALRGNALLRQPASQRRFRQAEVLAVVQVLKAWSLASWPNGGAELGMDRSTFCRFLLDTGLADQRKVPFFWAVSLFDSSARLVRYCAEEEAAVGTAPLLPVVNWKDLWQILEALVQQYFRPSSSAMRLKFIESIAEISRARLPSFAVKMMNISKEHLNLMIQGVGTEDRDSDAEDERAKAPRSLRVPSAKARQLSILEEARKQRLRSLLVEPEVLQLLWQHEDVFKELHSAYADERGHLSFAAVVQLCKDFSLAPRLISLHLLRKIYESSECLELDLEADETQERQPGPRRPGEAPEVLAGECEAPEVHLSHEWNQYGLDRGHHGNLDLRPPLLRCLQREAEEGHGSQRQANVAAPGLLRGPGAVRARARRADLALGGNLAEATRGAIQRRYALQLACAISGADGDPVQGGVYVPGLLWQHAAAQHVDPVAERLAAGLLALHGGELPPQPGAAGGGRGGGAASAGGAKAGSGCLGHRRCSRLRGWHAGADRQGSA